MSAEDRRRWDERYRDADLPPVTVPSSFVGVEHHFPTAGRALDVACGTGAGSLWLARRGLDVLGIDVSAVAVERATQRALTEPLQPVRVEFRVHDIDDGLPDGPFDVVVSHLFQDRRLDDAMVQALSPGGVLAIAALSEVGGSPGRFRVAAGELEARFAPLLDVVERHEAEGVAVLVGRR